MVRLELSYRCNLGCIHCYCKGSEDRDRELTTKDWKKILNVIQKQGCLRVLFTGGDPLIRDDFLEIYSYAKAKGFVVTLFTNGYALTAEIIDYLVKSPPFSIEITLNGITKDTYETITQVEGSFIKVMQNIKILAKRQLPLLLKSNCMKHNKHEIGRIKAFTEDLLGKPSENKHHFRYDTEIRPRLNKDRSPTNFRLSYDEMLEVWKQDPDIWQQYQDRLHRLCPDFKRDRSFLYNCNTWMRACFINPYGWLKFCQFSDKFSINLKTTPFQEGFYKIFPQVLKQRFKTNSKCKDCHLRSLCNNCPAKAYLEAGDDEAPVTYYCELAKARADEILK
jgi:radical SAM protein with 4Fe4S-binding SPASM domain